MDLYPAIDLRGGRVVRLEQGDFAREREYGTDPLQVARQFADAGASWVHIVDLDAAKGDGNNRAVVSTIAAALGASVKIQTGGGVRTLDDAQQLADAGVTRVVMGSAAVRDPGLVDVLSRVVRVAVGLDHRNGEVATHGWLRGSTLTLKAAVVQYPSADAFVITDISRDGMLAGPDIDGLRDIAQLTTTQVIASGGVAELDDLRALRDVRVGSNDDVRKLGGVIVGKAIYEERFTVAEAVKALRA
ncbi:MAG: 1-(5-phosphoribosyl)-5-[(5-phosphoribosylamino) methylideneamino] imidazole-4-carboxamide isomerase [Actinomycetota bacterium]